MFAHTMRMVLGLSVFAGMIAYGWTTVLGALGDKAISDAGVPPKVWKLFKEYKPEGEVADIKQVMEFAEETARNDFPPSFLRGQFMEFCQKDVAESPKHDLDACRACFNMVIDNAYRWYGKKGVMGDAKQPEQVFQPITAPADSASARRRAERARNTERRAP